MPRNREFVMLGKDMPSDPRKVSIGSWKLSEKLDGMRGLWIPHTRGMDIRTVPFANLDRKSGDAGERIATGLWSRYGNVIEAPDWWLSQLPLFPLDGELYMGRGTFQLLTSTVKAWKTSRDWSLVRYNVFDAPRYQEVFLPGVVNNVNYKKEFTGVPAFLAKEAFFPAYDPRFDIRLSKLKQLIPESGVVKVHEHQTLPWQNDKAYDAAIDLMQKIVQEGGEGIVVKFPFAEWLPYRSSHMFKLKPEKDAEATVVGHTDGKGRLVGMTGALSVKDNKSGKLFDLAGLTDFERRDAPTIFPVGTVVTYMYRELTRDGYPKEARYFRKRPKE